MATYEGSNGSVKIKSGTDTLTAVASVRSWTVDVTRDIVEDTAMGDGARTYKKGLQSWSGSMDVVYDDSENTIVATAFNPDTDTAVTVEFYPDNSVAGTKFAGEVIVTSYSITASYDGLVEATLSFQGNGALSSTNY